MQFQSSTASLTRSLVAGLLLLTAACHFTYDRKVEPGEISGTVVFQGSPGAPSLPAVGARVAIENSSIAVLTDSQGSFSIRQLPPQKYTLDFTATSAGSRVVDFGLRMPNVVLKDSSGNNGQDLGKLAIAELGGLAGTVTNMTSPVEGATIALTSIATAKTAHGSYEFQNLLPGDYTISAFEATPAGGLLSNLMTVTVKPRQVVQIPNVELAQAMLITSGSANGTALTQGGASGVAVSVSLQTLPDVQQTTDSGGNYNLMNVPAGVYTVVASASGFRTAMAVGVVIAGPPTDVPLLMLSPLSVAEPPDAGPPLPTTTAVTSADGGTDQQMVPMTADGGTPVAPSSSGGGATQSSSTNYTASTSTGAPTNKVLGSTHFRFTPSGGVPSLTNGGTK